MDWFNSLRDDICRYIGQTVTIFTTSGGISGSGFTGVLISVNECSIRLLVSAGDSPACALGSNCGGPSEFAFNFNANCNGSALGAIAIIPTCAIAAFTHNAI